MPPRLCCAADAKRYCRASPQSQRRSKRGKANSAMPQTVRIAIDLMGGDNGPEPLVPGASIARERRPDIRYMLYGRESEVMPLLDRYPSVRDFSTFHHTDVAVKMDDKPSQALRAGRWKS